MKPFSGLGSNEKSKIFNPDIQKEIKNLKFESNLAQKLIDDQFEELEQEIKRLTLERKAKKEYIQGTILNTETSSVNNIEVIQNNEDTINQIQESIEEIRLFIEYLSKMKKDVRKEIEELTSLEKEFKDLLLTINPERLN